MIKKLDYTLIFAVFFLTLFGLVLLYSSTGLGNASSNLWLRQMFYLLPAVFFLFICSLIDYEFWKRNSGLIYVIIILLLIGVLFFGESSRGAQRWIQLAGFTFQPSEFAKIFIVIILAKILTLKERFNVIFWISIFFYIFIPLLLILIQPDLGTTLVIIAVTLSLFYFAGMKPLYLLFAVITGGVLSPFVLKEYQKERLLIFLNPGADPHGAGWNILQSKIAIGSGKLLGKGLFLGTQSHLSFVPEHSTDFIFTIAAEELGFIGAIIIILLYFIILKRALEISAGTRDSFGRYLALGICAIFLFQIFVNICMTMGIMPVTGIPLIFLSYGGSSLITSFMCIGILLSIYIRREKIF